MATQWIDTHVQWFDTLVKTDDKQPEMSRASSTKKSWDKPTPFAQTDLDAHKAWAQLSFQEPRASGVLHLLVSMMVAKADPVVIIPQKTIAKICGCHVRTAQRALDVLVDDRWIEAIRLGQGNVCAYRVNSKAAWLKSRKDLTYSQFTASVVADWDDQSEFSEEELRDISFMMDGNMPPAPVAVHTLEAEIDD